MASTDEKTALLSTAEAAHKAQTRRAAVAVLCALALVGSAAAVVKSRVATPKPGRVDTAATTPMIPDL